MTLPTYNAMPPLGGDSTPRNCRASLKTRAAPACTDQANIGGRHAPVDRCGCAEKEGYENKGTAPELLHLPYEGLADHMVNPVSPDTHAISEERKRLARIATEYEAE